MKQLKILVPIDFSYFSKIGVRYALILARTVGAQVVIYHSVDCEDPIDYETLIKVGNKTNRSASVDVQALLRRFKRAFDHYGEARASRSYYAPVASVKVAKEALAQFLKQNFSELLSGLNSSEVIELGRAQQKIVEAAKRHSADLIVMSTHGRSGLAHVLRGSVTEHVIRNAPCPVVAIGPESVEKMQAGLAAA
jgi:nucleotide-binding universal stress UspA family protein